MLKKSSPLFTIFLFLVTAAMFVGRMEPNEEVL
jgi:hypothetical protein